MGHCSVLTMTELLNSILLYFFSNSSTLLNISLFPSFCIVGRKLSSYKKKIMKKRERKLFTKSWKKTLKKTRMETLKKRKKKLFIKNGKEHWKNEEGNTEQRGKKTFYKNRKETLKKARKETLKWRRKHWYLRATVHKLASIWKNIMTLLWFFMSSSNVSFILLNALWNKNYLNFVLTTIYKN